MTDKYEFEVERVLGEDLAEIKATVSGASLEAIVAIEARCERLEGLLRECDQRLTEGMKQSSWHEALLREAWGYLEEEIQAQTNHPGTLPLLERIRGELDRA